MPPAGPTLPLTPEQSAMVSELAERTRRLALHLAAKLDIDRDDAISVSYETLCRIVRYPSWDHERSVGGYLRRSLWGELVDWSRSDKTIHIPRAYWEVPGWPYKADAEFIVGRGIASVDAENFAPALEPAAKDASSGWAWVAEVLDRLRPEVRWAVEERMAGRSNLEILGECEDYWELLDEARDIVGEIALRDLGWAPKPAPREDQATATPVVKEGDPSPPLPAPRRRRKKAEIIDASTLTRTWE